MTKNLLQRFRRAGASIAVCVAGLVLVILVSACAGVSGTNGSVPGSIISGSVISVDAQHHSVSIKFNGQTITINGLTDQEVATLQSQLSKTFSFNVTQNSDGSYTVGNDPNSVTEDNTPEANNNETATTEQTGPNEPGDISFIGTVKSISNTSIVVSLPDGSTLAMLIANGQTDLSDFNGGLPGLNQLIKVDATANTDGSFLATKLSTTDSGDLQNQYTVDFDGVTTSAVGSDHVIYFKVGNRSFHYTIASSADLSDFNGNAQSISNNTAVQVEVQFQGNAGTVTKVSNPNS